MTGSLKQWQRSNIVLATGAILLNVGLFFWAMYWKTHFKSSVRQVVSMLEIASPQGGANLQVVKLQEHGLMAVEVFEITKTKVKLLQRIDLRGQSDAYFRYREQNSNLIVQELHDNGDLLLLAPSLDQDLVAHLNVYVLRKGDTSFVPISSDFQL